MKFVCESEIMQEFYTLAHFFKYDFYERTGEKKLFIAKVPIH